jgi:nitrite reductase (NO-forming)
MVYKFMQPGVYAYVNHNPSKPSPGATAHVVVEGEWDDDLMMQVVNRADQRVNHGRAVAVPGARCRGRLARPGILAGCA